MCKVLLALFVAISFTYALVIPAGYQLIGDKYLVAKIEVTFLEALVQCKSYGYNLAVVKNATDQNLLENRTSNGFYWLGAVYENTSSIFDQGKWIWLEDNNDVNYTNWHSDEPVLQTGINCVALHSGYWYSYSCNDHKYQFVCQTSD